MTDEGTTSKEIRFGIRRFGLAMVSFVGTGSAFVVWSRFVEAPMFVFPFGHLEADEARVVLLLVGMVSVLFGTSLAYVRFVKKPRVLLRRSSITIPVGEFARTMIQIARGDVLEVREEGPRAGGWRTCHVRHRGGTFAVRSSQLPSDDDFFEICRRLRAFQRESASS